MTRRRSLIAGMTDYTGVSIETLLSHLRDWKAETEKSVASLARLRISVSTNSARFNRPNQLLSYLNYFIDLFTRYAGDFDRLLAALPVSVLDAHIELLRQLVASAELEEEKCVRFKQVHIETELKDEALRPIIDEIYSESRGMLQDYLDLSNLGARLRTFVGTVQTIQKEMEQKFRILCSAAQEQRDFDDWTSKAKGADAYSLGVIFVDVDDFKRLNSQFTESIVDKTILPRLQTLVRDACLHRGEAYRHGGEELVVLLPNCSLEEARAFADTLRGRVESCVFTVDPGHSVKLTISAGVAAWPMHGNTLNRVLEAANRAEHTAKAQGKNRVCVASTSP